MNNNMISGWKDKVLYTPGPLTTSKTVKQAMLRDVGHRDTEFINIIAEIRKKILEMGNVLNKGYESILLSGSGSYAVEAVLSTATPENGKWLVVINGAYGRRISKILEVLKINKTELVYPENKIPDINEIEAVLKREKDITHVAIVHSETTTGLINPIDPVADLCKKYDKIYFVDAMSSFGALPINIAQLGIHYLVCTANKNIEGVPGFAFAIAHKDTLLNTKGNARSYVLDLYDQWMGLESNGQFRFSPPTHSILAFYQAIKEMDQEGGVIGRQKRYQENVQTLIAGMDKLGFKRYIDDKWQGNIIVSFCYPDHPNFNFDKFYKYLNERDYVIYPGKVAQADLFRLATCGRLFKNDMLNIIAVIKEAYGSDGSGTKVIFGKQKVCDK